MLQLGIDKQQKQKSLEPQKQSPFASLPLFSLTVARKINETQRGTREVKNNKLFMTFNKSKRKKNAKRIITQTGNFKVNLIKL